MNPKISLPTIKIQWLKITLISVYASTEGKTREEKGNFYDKLGDVVDKIPNTRLLVILGDLNTKIKK